LPLGLALLGVECSTVARAEASAVNTPDTPRNSCVGKIAMQLFLRLVPENENSTVDDLAKTVTELLQDKTSLHMYAPIVSHHRGGYCVYLE
jgi:hypothetical protein